MKLTLERAPLLAALNRANKVVERRNTIPILSHVLLRASAGGLVLIATDLDQILTQTIPAEVSAEGATTVSAQTLRDIVSKLPDGAQLTLEDGSKGVQLRASRSRFVLQTLPDGDFPDFGAMEEANSFTVAGKALAAAFGMVSFAISTEETRYYLNGIHMHRQGEGDTAGLACVATDGHRLARHRLTLPGLADDAPGIIVPTKAVERLREMAEAADTAEIRIGLSATKLSAEHNGTRFTTKLIDGSFPDYQRVIPQANTRIAQVDGEALRAAIDRVATLSAGKGRAVKFTFADGALTLAVANPDAGDAEETLDTTFEGEPIEIGFNASYALATITALGKAGPLEIALDTPGSPTIFRRPNEDATVCVLMPMRV